MFLRNYNVVNRFDDPVLRHFAWDFTDFLMFAMWAFIYGMHVHPEDQGSFALICLFCMVPATYLLYKGGRELFFEQYNLCQKLIFIMYYLICPWVMIAALVSMVARTDSCQYCQFYRKYNSTECPYQNFEDCFAQMSNSSGPHDFGVTPNITGADNDTREMMAQYDAYFSPEFKVMAMFALVWYMGLWGLSIPRVASPAINSTETFGDAGGNADAASKPLLPGPDTSAGDAHIRGPMNPLLAKHLLNELLYDCFALSIQVWLLTEIRMKDSSFQYKVFIDFVNLGTTCVDLFMLKGPSFLLHILKSGGSPEKIFELMLQTAEDLKQQAQQPEGQEKSEGEGGAQGAESPPHASKSCSANGGGSTGP